MHTSALEQVVVLVVRAQHARCCGGTVVSSRLETAQVRTRPRLSLLNLYFDFLLLLHHLQAKKLLAVDLVQFIDDVPDRALQSWDNDILESIDAAVGDFKGSVHSDECGL